MISMILFQLLSIEFCHRYTSIWTCIINHGHIYVSRVIRFLTIFPCLDNSLHPHRNSHNTLVSGIHLFQTLYIWWWKQIEARAKITCPSPLGLNWPGVQSISGYFVTVVGDTA